MIRFTTIAHVSILALTLVACGGKKKSGDTNACTEAADKAVQGLMGSVATSATMPEDVKAGMKDRGERLEQVLVTHCTQDKWSADVIACYRDATSMQTIRACRTKLPPDQAGKLLSDEMGAMRGGPMGPGMMGPHGEMGGMGPHGAMGGMGGPPGGTGEAHGLTIPPPAGSGSAGTGSGSASATGSGGAAR